MATLRYATLFLNDISIKQKVRASRAQLCTVVQRRKSSADRSEYRIPIYLLPIRRVTIIRFSLAILQMMEEFHLNNRNVKQSHQVHHSEFGRKLLFEKTKQTTTTKLVSKSDGEVSLLSLCCSSWQLHKTKWGAIRILLLALSRSLRCDNDQQQQCKTN